MKVHGKLVFHTLVSLLVFFLVADSVAKPQGPTHGITTRDLEKKDKAWFVREFSRSFMKVYANKTFVITKDAEPVILGPTDSQDKRNWIEKTAQAEFHDYIETPQEGYKGVFVLKGGYPVGAFLYRLIEKGKILYIAQYFIIPETNRKDIDSPFLQEYIPKLHPDLKRCEVVVRHQNDIVILLFRDLGFSLGDIPLVQKYGYDPLRYLGFYKEF